MSYNRLLQPKINPFGVIIYSPKEGNVILKQFPDKIISENELNKFSKGTYCNSFNNLLLSEGKYFWIINNTSFNVRKKKLPIEKNNHSMIFLPCTKGAGRVFIIGGSDRKTFFYDLKKNYFINWAETNEVHNKPILIKIDDYLYIMDSLKQQNFCFERTKLSDNEKRWEKIIPNFDKKIISNFPSGGLAAALDSNGSVVFLGGDNINLMNNSYIYDPKNNNVSISLNGTNDSVNFCDKNFYKFNKKYSIALPRDMEEVKEIVMIDKDEQSLIKTHIDLPKKGNCKIIINQSEYTFPKTKIRSNMIYVNNANMTKVNYRNINPNIQIKEEPKEFGYYISSNSSEQVRIKAQKDRIKMVQINPKHVPYKSSQAIEIIKELYRRQEPWNDESFISLLVEMTEDHKLVGFGINERKTTRALVKVQPFIERLYKEAQVRKIYLSECPEYQDEDVKQYFEGIYTDKTLAQKFFTLLNNRALHDTNQVSGFV